MKRAITQSWGTSNGTFQTKKAGLIDIFFMEYSASKLVKLTPDIVEYEVGAQGMVQAYVGQKLLKRDILRVFTMSYL
jgi:preprotein translocase subunit Sec61beta